MERRSALKQKPIITGRWGTGKTATLLLRHHSLSKALETATGTNEELWYIDEKGLYPEVLLHTVSHESDDKSVDFHLRTLWMSEIYRRTAHILAILIDDYGPHSGDHWAFISRIRRSAKQSVWQSLLQALNIITNPTTAPPLHITEMTGTLQDFLDPNSHEAVRRCLHDISSHSLRPRIGIEPIESPGSPLEQNSLLATRVIRALLNVFQESFVPGPRNPLSVTVAIPWHRFDRASLDQPQHLVSQFATLDWAPDELKEFLDRRIAWEFERVGRKRNRKADPWHTLFAKSYVNHAYTAPIREETFPYVLRNTHYRPRDVQQIVRQAVLMCATQNGLDTDHVLRGHNGIQVNATHLAKAAIEINSLRAVDRINEASRHYPEVPGLCRILHGLTTPFTTDVLAARLASPDAPSIDITAAVRALWDSGIIGLTLPEQPEAGYRFALERASLTRYTTAVPPHAQYSRYYLCHYNCLQSDFEGLANAIRSSGCVVEYFVHPVFNNLLHPLVGQVHPYGV